MLRMFSVLSEVSGVRPETMCLVTDSIGEAIDWLAAICKLDCREAAILCNLVEPDPSGPLEIRVPEQARHQRDG